MEKTKHKEYPLADPIAATIFSTLFIILFNAFYGKINILTDDFEKVVPLFNASLGVGLALQISRIFVRSYEYKIVTDVISLIFFVILSYYFWTIYPFDTSAIGNKNLWDPIFRFLIVFPPVVVFIATTVNVVKLIIEKCRVPEKEEKDKPNTKK